MQYARLMGAQIVILAGRNDKKLEVGRKFSGADYTINIRNGSIQKLLKEVIGEKEINLIIEASGNLQAMHDSLEIIGKFGRISIPGSYPNKEEKINISIMPDKEISWTIRKEDIEMLEKYNIEYTGKDCKSEEDFIKFAKDADIIFDQGCYNITEKVQDNLPKLMAILRRGIGFDNVDYKVAAKKGICVGNTPGFCSDEVSTHTIAFLFSFARNIPKYDSFIKQKNGTSLINTTGIWSLFTMKMQELLDLVTLAKA